MPWRRAADDTPPGGPGWSAPEPMAGLVAERCRNVLLVTHPEPSTRTAGRVEQLRRVAEAVADADPGEQVPTVLFATVPGNGVREFLDALGARLPELAPDREPTEIRWVAETSTALQAEFGEAAHRFADLHGVRVVTSFGRLLHVPGHTVFPVHGTSSRSWQQFVPGHPQPVPAGPWFFGATWRSELALLPAAGLVPGLRVLPVPAGVVLLPASGVELPLDDIVYSVPMDPRRPLVIVPGTMPEGATGEHLTAEQVAGYLALLPARLRATVRPVVAGPLPEALFWQEVAEELEDEIAVLTGLPVLFGDEIVVSVPGVGTDGEIEVLWQPLATELRFEPAYGGPARPGVVVEHRVVQPLWGSDDGWKAEIIAGGLWFGPSGAQVGDAVLPTDPGRPVLLVNGTDGDEAVTRRVGELRERLRQECGAPPRTLFLPGAQR
ncbi:hypothetical protein KIH74_28120 [Kineosporia sp. J2-2]|uniref:Uncharacterized protein n=1 Tax=Kineosporia corallincola TaxID=2835133 RepID=A0ABS5TQV4_9ACTN|nr:hypothetical protein [Kineosporia corallincola]MBT0772841.1 hypothetical protein [Kineosporia corallincola]